MSTQAEAEIFDRGYRAYDGERSGVPGAMRAVYVESMQRAIGLRRRARFKIVPFITIVLAYLPALAFMGIAILLPSEFADEVVADYSGYYGLLGIVVLLFTAFVAPELLSTDRRTGMFGLYMSSPLTRTTYLIAKGTGLMTVLLLVTLFPVVFLLIGYLTVGLGPDGVVETAKIVGKIAVSGAIVSVYFGLIGMAISTLTNRKGFASAGIVMFMVASGVFSGILHEVAEAPDWVQLFNFANVPFDVTTRVFGETVDRLEGVSTLASISMWAAVCAVSVGIIALGFSRMQVTK